MNRQISQLIEKIRLLEDTLEIELAKRREELRFSIENRKVIFEQEIIRQHKLIKTRLVTYILKARPKILISAPFIYSLIVPFVLLDLMISLYQWVCFPVYGIEKVKREHYFVYDRHQLSYLNLVEKINCAYCSYGNGLIAYVREITGRTEQYWCPIKHTIRLKSAHAHYHKFLDYGDAESYQQYLDEKQKTYEKRAQKEGDKDV